MSRPAYGSLVALCLASLAWGTAQAEPSARATPAALPVLGEIPSFTAVDQDGQTVTNADLLGHPWVADFIFTQCTTSCPILSAHMVLLQRAVTDPRVRFLSFSVDPEHDAPAVLKAYGQRWSTDPRWRLLRASQKALSRVIAGVGFVLERTGDPDDPIVHTNGYLLVDAYGFVRGTYSSEDAAQRQRLRADLATLVSAARKSTRAAPGSGSQLFTELGCAGCHADAKLATPLTGLFGSVVRLSDGKTLMADEAYLRESIVAPSAKLVAGYPASMPSYAQLVSAKQLDQLVAHIKSLTGPRREAPTRALVVDPVCKMEISAGADTPQLEHKGATYYFCSDACRDKFVHDPARYERSPSGAR